MLFSAALAFHLHTQAMPPVLWLHPNGEIIVNGVQTNPRLTEGVSVIRMRNGVGYDFVGRRGGMLFDDPAPLKLPGSMTVSTWLYTRSYVNDGPGAQVLFRGDDRNGMDPFNLSITHDGTINFGIGYNDGNGMSLKGQLPLNKWVHVMANYNSDGGDMNLFVDGKHVAFAIATKTPIVALEENMAPGVSVGNVQNNNGPHNQPFNGIIADLRLYNYYFAPRDLQMTQREW